MIRAGLARTHPSYAELHPPFGPGKLYPEFAGLLGDSAGAGPANPVYAGVRAALLGLGLDEENFGSEAWNPLGKLVRSGGDVVLKPNFIRHWNPREDSGVESVITHGSIVRAAADYARLAIGPEGSVTLAEAPQMDCDFERIRAIVGLDAIASFYTEELGLDFEILDLRREAVIFEHGIIVSRRDLPGDPKGYRRVDLGERSFFHGSGLDPERFRGADYDPGPTAEHHRDGRNEYLLSETVLSADLVVNLPKLKTHKKTGVTLALKNLVGINGDKNWLPHHCVGPERDGGDEFPNSRLVDRARSRATEIARPWLQRGKGLRLFGWARRMETAVRGDDFIRSGNWYGNRTTWRMCLDLNRCLYYSTPKNSTPKNSDAKDLHLDAPAPVRTVLTLLDGIVAGEGAGPLAPSSRPLGVVIAATDPLAVDLVAVRLMGFDENRLPKIREAMRDDDLRITALRGPEDLLVYEVSADSFESRLRRVDEIEPERPFATHPGWRGRIERTSR
jgi:uncharacterized protein (DUF362 family)